MAPEDTKRKSFIDEYKKRDESCWVRGSSSSSRVSILIFLIHPSYNCCRGGSFSAAGYFGNKLRNWFESDNLEALIFLHSHFQISPYLPFGSYVPLSAAAFLRFWYGCPSPGLFGLATLTLALEIPIQRLSGCMVRVPWPSGRSNHISNDISTGQQDPHGTVSIGRWWHQFHRSDT